MPLWMVLLYGLAMLVGLVGVVVPVVPGLLLVGAVAAVWAFDAGGGSAWWVLAAVLAILVAGTVAKYVLPGRALRDAGAPRSTLALGVLGAVVGFFVVPVVGLLLGGVLGVYVGERRRLGSGAGAWRSTVATLRAVGVGMLLELAAGVVAVLVWFVAALALR